MVWLFLCFGTGLFDPSDAQFDTRASRMFEITRGKRKVTRACAIGDDAVIVDAAVLTRTSGICASVPTVRRAHFFKLAICPSNQARSLGSVASLGEAVCNRTMISRPASNATSARLRSPCRSSTEATRP